MTSHDGDRPLPDTPWFTSEVAIAAGHPQVPPDPDRLHAVVMTDEGLIISKSVPREKVRVMLALRWPEILGLRAEDENAITERLTAPRMLFLGAWALLAPKKEAKSFLTVSLPESGLTLAVLGTNVYALRQLVENLHRWTGVPILPSSASAQPPSDGVPSGSVPERLQQLQELLDAELISDAEYTQRREAILDSI